MQGPGLPSLDQLKVFLTVVETGSFAAAGRRLRRATSAVSYSVANLEQQLGVSLFDRERTRKPTLTKAGAAVLTEARTVSLGVDKLRAKVKGLLDGLEAAHPGLRARVLAHVRCNAGDIYAAIRAGVQGVNLTAIPFAASQSDTLLHPTGSRSAHASRALAGTTTQGRPLRATRSTSRARSVFALRSASRVSTGLGSGSSSISPMSSPLSLRPLSAAPDEMDMPRG